MSSGSESACLSVIRGLNVSTYFDIQWIGDAEETWDKFVLSYNLEQIVHPHEEAFSRYTGRSIPQHYLYLAKCFTFDRRNFVYKVGIGKCVADRIAAHSFNPMLAFDKEQLSCVCGSKKTAYEAETSFLVAAAKAGAWIGGEWIAGSPKTKSLLSITPKCVFRDRRRRVRRHKELRNVI